MSRRKMNMLMGIKRFDHETKMKARSERSSQKVTYLFCDEPKIVSKELMSRVRQATKDVVKSEV